MRPAMAKNGLKHRLLLEQNNGQADSGKTSDAPSRGFWTRWGWTLGIGVWMFLLGIWVGRSTVPVAFDMQAIEKKLVALKSQALQEEQEKFRRQTEALKDVDDLAFHGALKDEETPGESAPKPPADPDAAAPRTLTPRLSKGETQSPPRSPPSPGEGEDSSATEEKTASASAGKRQIVSSPASPLPGGDALSEAEKQVTIQVASFKEAGEAEEMVRMLRKKGYRAYVLPGEIPDKGFYYRVRVGAFKRRADARQTLKRLKADKLTGAYYENYQR